MGQEPTTGDGPEGAYCFATSAINRVALRKNLHVREQSGREASCQRPPRLTFSDSNNI